MRVIIAGSRTITDYAQVKKILDSIDLDIDEVVCGCARGVDELGKWYAGEYKIPIKEFPADWNDINSPGAVVKTNPNGKYNALAGIQRNRLMAEYADALILIWDGKSKGSKNMLQEAIKRNLIIKEVVI